MDGTQRQKTERVALTAAMIAALHAQVERTGICPRALVKNSLGASGEISENLLNRWLSGARKSVCPVRYDLVLKTWQGLPAQDARYVAITLAIQAVLRERRDRSGVGIVKLLARRDDMPEGLTVQGAERFYRSRAGKIRCDHLDYILECWRALPDRAFIALSPEIVAALRGHMKRTGKGSSAILRGARGKPEGLNANEITRWLGGKAAAREDHLDYVLKRYAATGDRVPVTAAIRAEMNHHIRRTGVRAETLRRDEGERAGWRVRNWIEARSETAPRNELERVLDLWRALPDRPGGKPETETPEARNAERVALTLETRARLRGHWMRVGLPVAAFFEGFVNPPSGLSVAMIQSWIGESAPRRVRKDHLEFVMTAWEQLPDGLGRVKSIHFLPFEGKGGKLNDLLR